MIEGITIKLNGAEYVIPPLNLGQVKRLLPVLDAMQKTTEPMEKFSSVVTVTHAALSRNYPEMKIEDVEELIDLGNIKMVLDAVMGVSGLLRGEANLGSVLTGIPSTATL
jgi:hypothetical protein